MRRGSGPTVVERGVELVTHEYRAELFVNGIGSLYDLQTGKQLE